MTFTLSCTCSLNKVKTLKLSWLMGKTKSLKALPNIYLMIHGLNTFGLIMSKLICELTLNPLLLFHHVVHIPNYSLLELNTNDGLSNPMWVLCILLLICGWWVSTSVTFKPRHTNINWILPWGIEMLVLFGNKGASRSMNWLINVEIHNNGYKTIHAQDWNEETWVYRK